MASPIVDQPPGTSFDASQPPRTSFVVNREKQQIHRKAIYYPKPRHKVYSFMIITGAVIVVLLLVCIICVIAEVSGWIFLLMGVPVCLVGYRIVCSYQGRNMCVNSLRCLYANCCCSIDFVSTKTIGELIGRYQDEAILSKEVSYYLCMMYLKVKMFKEKIRKITSLNKRKFLF